MFSRLETLSVQRKDFNGLMCFVKIALFLSYLGHGVL